MSIPIHTSFHGLWINVCISPHISVHCTFMYMCLYLCRFVRLENTYTCLPKLCLLNTANKGFWLTCFIFNKHMTNVIAHKASLIAQSVKNLPAMQETPVWFQGQEDPWRRKWQSIPVFLPGESHEQRSLAGYSPWGRKSWTRLSN